MERYFDRVNSIDFPAVPSKPFETLAELLISCTYNIQGFEGKIKSEINRC